MLRKRKNVISLHQLVADTERKTSGLSRRKGRVQARSPRDNKDLPLKTRVFFVDCFYKA